MFCDLYVSHRFVECIVSDIATGSSLVSGHFCCCLLATVTAFKSEFPVVLTVIKIKMLIILSDQTIAVVVSLLVSE